ncbi:hypothetical protein C0989_008263 [Termitomyces sp. Mn162]|nr:hypothetical protein C0989_008263 [Termitomyces sp. Mn162]
MVAGTPKKSKISKNPKLKETSQDCKIRKFHRKSIPRSNLWTRSLKRPVNQRTTDGQEDPDVEWEPMICVDSMKPEWEKKDKEEEDLEQGKVGDSDVASFTEGWGNEDASMYGEGRQIKLVNLSISNGDDPWDENWVPAELKRKHEWNCKQQQGVFLGL